MNEENFYVGTIKDIQQGSETKPFKIKVNELTFSTFKGEIVKGFKYGDVVKIKYSEKPYKNKFGKEVMLKNAEEILGTTLDEAQSNLRDVSDHKFWKTETKAISNVTMEELSKKINDFNAILESTGEGFIFASPITYTGTVGKVDCMIYLKKRPQ